MIFTFFENCSAFTKKEDSWFKSSEGWQADCTTKISVKMGIDKPSTSRRVIHKNNFESDSNRRSFKVPINKTTKIRAEKRIIVWRFRKNKITKNKIINSNKSMTLFFIRVKLRSGKYFFLYHRFLK